LIHLLDRHYCQVALFPALTDVLSSETRTRPKKAKVYNYIKECKPVNREVSSSLS